MRAQLGFVATLLVAAAPQLVAQSDTTSGALVCASRGTGPRVAIGSHASSRATSVLDTTIVLRIDDRTWTRDSLDAGIAFGAAGSARAGSVPWSVCTGATANVARIAATLRGVHGQIHFRVDPSALGALTNSTAAPKRK